MSSLPEQIEANLSIHEMLRSQLVQDNINLKAAENRRAAIARDLAELRTILDQGLEKEDEYN